jgi:hypothetical protein
MSLAEVALAVRVRRNGSCSDRQIGLEWLGKDVPARDPDSGFAQASQHPGVKLYD